MFSVYLYFFSKPLLRRSLFDCNVFPARIFHIVGSIVKVTINPFGCDSSVWAARTAGGRLPQHRVGGYLVDEGGAGQGVLCVSDSSHIPRLGLYFIRRRLGSVAA
jgi:hypothetical protein